MPVHVFVDEFRRVDYVLCAVVVAPDDLVRSRGVMRELKPGNRRRLHMHSEGAARRRQILAEFSRRCPIREAHVWIAPLRGRPERLVRDECFSQLVPAVINFGADRIVVESCSQDAQDARVIGDAVARSGAIGDVHFDIVPAAGEEMLWAADLIGWAWGAGGRERQSVAHLVTVHQVP